MNPINHATTVKLQKAAEQVVDYVETGLTPNEALAKTAAAMDLEPGHIRLVGRAYNIGETTRIRDAGESVLDKSASFLIADPEAVIESLYPTSIKAAAKAVVVSSEYAAPPTKVIRDIVESQVYEGVQKAASLAEELWGKPAVCNTTKPKKTEDRFQTLNRLKQMRSQKSAALAASYDQFVKNAEALRFWFSQPGHVRLGDFADTLQHGWSKAASAVVTYVESRLPEDRTRAVGNVLFNNTHVAPAVAFLEKAAEAYEAICSLSPEVDQLTSDCDALQLELCNVAKKTAAESILDAAEKNAAVPPFVNAAVFGGMSNIGRNITDGILGDPDDESLVLKQVAKIDSPDHKRQIQEIRRQVMLDDMFNNDPVISSFEPEEIANAYNRIASLGPSVASNPLLMESQLRRYLSQGQLDPFEGRAIVDTETAIRKQTMGGSKKDDNSER